MRVPFPTSMILAFMAMVAGLQTANAQVDRHTLWRDAVVTELDVNFGNTGFHARWHFHRCHCGDLQVKVEQVAPDSVLTGELLMVDGQVLLSKGFTEQGKDIEPLIQAPSLMLQLALELLNRGQPDGPHSVDTRQKLEIVEKNRDFKLDTGLATGVFAAPWKVQGVTWKTENGHRRFEFQFQFSNAIPEKPDGTTSMTFSGDFDFRKQGFPYPPSTSLDGWRIQWLSLGEKEAKPAADGLGLEKLREQVKNP